MVLTATTLVVVLGATAVGDLQKQASVERAEQSLSQVDAEVSRVALGDEEFVRVSLGELSTGASVRADDGGWMRIAVDNSSGRTVLRNESLGRLVYRYDGRTVAYQGGGVWRGDTDGSSMVSSPETHYRGTTLTLPIVTINPSGTGQSGTAVRVTDEGTETVDGYGNPLAEGSVNVTVRSAYYEAWGGYFEERMDGAVTYDHDNDTATLRLVTPPERPTVDGAIVSGAGSGDTIELDNNALITSYNSSEGDNPDSGVGDGNGPVYASGPVKLNSGNVRVRGDIHAGDTVTFSDTSARIYGDVRCTRNNHGCVVDDTPSGYDVFRDGGQMKNTGETVDTPEPIGDLVSDRIHDARARNDNDETDDITSGTLDWDNDTITLDSGTYYLHEIAMDDGDYELVLDTSNGTIDLAVDGDFDLDGSTIRVEGGGIVRVYADVSDEVGGSGSMVLDNGASVEVRDGPDRTYNATKFWLYAPPGIDADIDSKSEFTGVIYAPGGRGAHGSVSLTSGTVYGAVIAHVTGMDKGDQRAEIHFDEALTDSDILVAAKPEAPRVTYMHLTVNEVEVELDG